MRRITMIAVAAATLAVGRARADLVLEFSFEGTDFTGTVFAAGRGSVTLAGDPRAATLADVSAFGFSYIQTCPTGTPAFTFGLASLRSFSVGMAADPRSFALHLTTYEVSSPSVGYGPQRFAVDSLDPGGAATQAGGRLDFFSDITRGRVNVSSIRGASAVPEPSSLAILGTAAAAGLVAMRRRKRAA